MARDRSDDRRGQRRAHSDRSERVARPRHRRRRRAGEHRALARDVALDRGRARHLRDLRGLDGLRRRQRHDGLVVRRSIRAATCWCRLRRSEACIVRADLDLREIDLARASLPLLGDLRAGLARPAARRGTAAAAGRRAMTFPIVEAPPPSPRRRPDRLRGDRRVARRVSARRTAIAPQHPARGHRTVGRRRFGGHRVSCARARSGPRTSMRSAAVRDVEPVRVSPTRNSSSMRSAYTAARSTSRAAVDGYLAVRAGCRRAPARQRHGAHAYGRALRSVGEARRAARRNRKQDGATAGLLYLARRRYAARQPARRPFQDAVWALARYLGVPQALVDKGAERRSRSRSNRRSRPRHHATRAPTRCWRSCCWATPTRSSSNAASRAAEVALVRRRVDATHWKRHLPTTAMLTNTAINEFYLTPGRLLRQRRAKAVLSG